MSFCGIVIFTEILDSLFLFSTLTYLIIEIKMKCDRLAYRQYVANCLSPYDVLGTEDCEEDLVRNVPIWLSSIMILVTL